MRHIVLACSLSGAVSCLPFCWDSAETCVAVNEVGWGTYVQTSSEYDGKGRLNRWVRESDKPGDSESEVWSFDDEGGVASVTWWISAGWSVSDTFFHDGNGCLVRWERFGRDGTKSCVESLTYDAAKRVAEDEYDGSGCFTLNYDGWPAHIFGPCQTRPLYEPSRWAPGLPVPPDGKADYRTVYNRDADGRVQRIDELRPPATGAVERAVYSERYEYDDAGNRVLLEGDGCSSASPCPLAPHDGWPDGRIVSEFDGTSRPLTVSYFAVRETIAQLVLTDTYVYTYDDAQHRVTLDFDGSYDELPDGVADERWIWIYDEQGNLIEESYGPPAASVPESRTTTGYDEQGRETSRQQEWRNQEPWRSTTTYSAGGLEERVEFDNFAGEIPSGNVYCAIRQVQLDGAVDYRKITNFDLEGHEIATLEEGRKDIPVDEICVGATAEDDDPEYDELVNTSHCR